MKGSYALYVFLLALLGALAASVERAEAFGYGYRANDPVQADRCYRGPAWNYMAAYYSSHRYYRARCYRGFYSAFARQHFAFVRLLPEGRSAASDT
jgi:hypothetical protein